MERIETLTGVRFFAALPIVISHFTSPYLQEHGFIRTYNLFFSGGSIAMSFFFSLSGFILVVSRTHGRPLKAADFYFSRFARIYPIYLVSLLLSANILLNIFRDSASVSAATFKVIAALSLTQAWFPATKMIWNFPAWFLTPLVLCYVLFPYLHAKISRSATKTLVGVWLLCSLTNIALAAVREWFDPAAPFVFTLFQFPPVFPVLVFVSGMAVGEFYCRRAADTTRVISRIEKAGSYVLFAIIAATVYVCILEPFVCEESIFTAVFSMVLYLLASNRGVWKAFFSTPVLVRFGESSYTIFIWQFPLYMWAAKIASVVFHIQTPSQSPTFLVTYLITTIGICFFTHRYIEDNAAEFLTRWYRRRFAAVTRSYPQPATEGTEDRSETR